MDITNYNFQPHNPVTSSIQAVTKVKCCLVSLDHSLHNAIDCLPDQNTWLMAGVLNLRMHLIPPLMFQGSVLACS